MPKYDALPKELAEQIEFDRKSGAINPYAFSDGDAIRRKTNTHDVADALRSNFIRDVDKILNCPFYNRYADKTQVFSFYKNDDITRRSLHVQLVSRIARTIGKALNLNLELIEAIALGHDLGHTPFGHAGEKILDLIYFERAGRHFAHNIQSVRVLDKIFPLNACLQTLSGIAGHNGEIEQEVYSPISVKDFNQFDALIENCYLDQKNNLSLSPNTLEGCVVRLCDIIAYLGKDRQDSGKTNIADQNNFDGRAIGTINAEIINNLSVNVIKNSYGKNYIKLDKQYFADLTKAKRDNYERIYLNDKTKEGLDVVKQMMSQIYNLLYTDFVKNNRTSLLYKYHVEYVNGFYYNKPLLYVNENPHQIVVDFIASMTDDYFIEFYKHAFPKSNLSIKFKGYFE